MARLLVTGGAIGVIASSLLERGEFGVHNQGPVPRNRAFTSFRSYLSQGFQHVLAPGVLGLTVLVLPPRLAFQ